MLTLCTLALTVGIAGAQAPVDATSASSPHIQSEPPDRFYVAGKLGVPQPVGIQALYSLADGQGPRWDLDLLLEPSLYQQSMGVGAGFRPFHNALVVGARARWLQLHPPWSRGYVFALDSALGLGPELGARWGLLSDDRLLVSLTAGGLFSPWGRAALPPMITMDLGVGWKIGER